MKDRLIEQWLPINEISIESIRERAAASALPPINWLHVWWARRPLNASRAAVVGNLLPPPTNKHERTHFLSLLGIDPDLQAQHEQIQEARARGERSKHGYAQTRSFNHTPVAEHADALRTLAKTATGSPDPVVLDITAGGGSIPFEAGRLGFRSIANELNPVATFILRATCEWPQRYGYQLG